MLSVQSTFWWWIIKSSFCSRLQWYHSCLNSSTGSIRGGDNRCGLRKIKKRVCLLFSWQTDLHTQVRYLCQILEPFARTSRYDHFSKHILSHIHGLFTIETSSNIIARGQDTRARCRTWFGTTCARCGCQEVTIVPWELGAFTNTAI